MVRLLQVRNPMGNDADWNGRMSKLQHWADEGVDYHEALGADGNFGDSDGEMTCFSYYEIM